MFCVGLAWLLLVYCAFLSLAQVCDIDDYSSNNDTEAWARRSYFYVGGQYVKTTLVILRICNLSLQWRLG
jgi:hypothetical protein